LGDLAYRRYGERVSTDTEVAVSNTRGIDGVVAGTHLATAFQADLQGKSLFTTVHLRYSPAGLETLTGTLNGGLEADVAFRKRSDRFGDLNLSLGHIDDNFDGIISHDDRLTFTGGKSWSHFGLQYIAGLDSQRNAGSRTLQRTGALSFSESLGKLSLFETIQGSSTGGSAGSAGQQQISLGMSRELFGGSAAYQIARSTQTGDASTGTGLSQSLSYRHSFGRKLDAQVIQSFQQSSNNGVSAALIDTAVSLTRRLSNVVALQVQADFFRQTGIGGGRGSTFNMSLIGPFGFGQPQGGVGRANPNLPAVIRGLVTFSTSSTPFAYNQAPQRGFNNAVIILDGKITQRSDASGEFEFRFVPQGTHTIRIDPATISPGLIADREYVTVTVLGGQTTSVQFNVGNFAGISGSVISQDQNGQKHPLGGVGISVDGVQAVTSAPDGRYQIGRLNPGAHTVSIAEATVPGNVAFLGDTKRTVTVSPGTSVPLNFVATPLGSISGNVLAPADGGFGQLVGLHNVYVVADPGDHAVITDDDGAFILDNMPPGTYTLSIDKDTLPEGLSVLSGPDGPLSIAGGASIAGVVFKLGAGAKDVVYTFNDGKRQAIHVAVEPASGPPGALLRIRATTNSKDVKSLFVESDVFGTFPLKFDARQNAWFGTATVPQLAKGDYAVTVTARRKDVNDGQALVPVDPSIPLFALRVSPHNAQAGQSAKVTLKGLVALDEGDSVVFEDGYKIVLPRPAGRVFTFDFRVWRKGLPYGATLVTKKGQNYGLVFRLPPPA
ncbi:MAG: large repetitive protein, partial [Chloroflexota bacterium]|nr:large repetitive protein [Chloroflexota bacterium]